MRIFTNDRAQRSLTKQYWQSGKEVLYKTSLPVIDMLGDIAPAEIKQRIPSLLKPDLMQKYVIDLWSQVGGKFASEMARKINSKKSFDDPELGMWEDAFRAYMYERSQKIAKKILSTQAEMLNQIIDKVTADALRSGTSIQTITGQLRDDFMRQLVTVQSYEAERIARTEVIGSSNKGSYDGAKSTGADIQKGWSTSGLAGIRQTHLLYESFGWKSMDFEYAPGLLHPGDPNGSPEEIINCRCTIIYNVD